MTVNTVENRKTYNGNGATTAFTTPYFLADADLAVYVDNVLQTITTHYTVAGAGVPAGGTVTFITAPPTGTSNVVIIRDPPLTQLLDLVENDINPAATREAAFDKLTMISQRLSERNNRAFRISDSDPTAVTGLELPLPAARASLYVAFDAAGDLVFMPATSETPAAVQVVNDIATLRTIAPAATRFIRTRYHTNVGDGGHGDWQPVTGAAPGTYTDNNGTIIVPTGGDGSAAWLRVVNEFITPEMFGSSLSTVSSVANVETSPVVVMGDLSITSDYFPPNSGMCGGSGHYDSASVVNLTGGASLRFGYENFNPASSGTLISRYSPLRNLTINQTADAPIIRSAEGHFQTIDHVAFKSDSTTTLSTTTPMIELGATLYNRYSSNYMNHGQGVGIRAVEVDYDKYYYGVNASWFEKSNFFGTGTAAQIHGFFSFTYNDIESSGYILPKLIIGDAGSVSTAPMAIVHGNYFEGGAGSSVATPPPTIQIEKDQGPNIEGNVFYANHTAHPSYGAAFMDSFAFIKSTTFQTHARINGNYFNSPTAGAGPGRAIDITTPSACYVEAIGNHWPTNQEHRIFINGVDVASATAGTQIQPEKRWIVQDRKHGIVRHNMQVRDLWIEYAGSGAGAIKAQAGRNHWISSWDGVTPIAVLNPGSWVGARLTLYTGVAITLQQGAGFFFLAKGANCTLPAGRSMEFIISPTGTVVEIGDYSARL